MHTLSSKLHLFRKRKDTVTIIRFTIAFLPRLITVRIQSKTARLSEQLRPLKAPS